MQEHAEFWKDYSGRFETFKLEALLKQARNDAGWVFKESGTDIRT